MVTIALLLSGLLPFGMAPGEPQFLSKDAQVACRAILPKVLRGRSGDVSVLKIRRFSRPFHKPVLPLLIDDLGTMPLQHSLKLTFLQLRDDKNFLSAAALAGDQLVATANGNGYTKLQHWATTANPGNHGRSDGLDSSLLG